MKITKEQLEQAIREVLEDDPLLPYELAPMPPEEEREKKINDAARHAVNMFVGRLPEDVYSHLGDDGAERLKEMARQALHAVLESEL